MRSRRPLTAPRLLARSDHAPEREAVPRQRTSTIVAATSIPTFRSAQHRRTEREPPPPPAGDSAAASGAKREGLALRELPRLGLGVRCNGEEEPLIERVENGGDARERGDALASIVRSCVGLIPLPLLISAGEDVESRLEPRGPKRGDEDRERGDDSTRSRGEGPARSRGERGEERPTIRSGERLR
jgi:hypothetical protein